MGTILAVNSPYFVRAFRVTTGFKSFQIMKWGYTALDKSSKQFWTTCEKSVYYSTSGIGGHYFLVGSQIAYHRRNYRPQHILLGTTSLLVFSQLSNTPSVQDLWFWSILMRQETGVHEENPRVMFRKLCARSVIVELWGSIDDCDTSVSFRQIRCI